MLLPLLLLGVNLEPTKAKPTNAICYVSEMIGRAGSALHTICIVLQKRS